MPRTKPPVPATDINLSHVIIHYNTAINPERPEAIECRYDDGSKVMLTRADLTGETLTLPTNPGLGVVLNRLRDLVHTKNLEAS